MIRDPILAAWRDPDVVLRLQLTRTTLRELRSDDASSLASLFRDNDVQRYLPGVPRTVTAFRRFAGWAERRRRTGRHLCFAIASGGRAIGLIQAWPLEPRAETVEWGFALGRPYWGRGLFQEAARAFVSHAVTRLGVKRLEARTAVANARGMAALLRLGAQPEGILRQCFTIGHTRVDCVLWSILASDWASSPAVAAGIGGRERHLPLEAAP